MSIVLDFLSIDGLVSNVLIRTASEFDGHAVEETAAVEALDARGQRRWWPGGVREGEEGGEPLVDDLMGDVFGPKVVIYDDVAELG